MTACKMNVCKFSRTAKERSQLKLYATDAKLQDMCVGMHRMGVRIDEGLRLQHETTLAREQAKQLEILKQTPLRS